MSQPNQLSSEFEFIEWMRKQTASDPRVIAGIGDDAAALRLTAGRDLLITTDMILEGVHFESLKTPARLVGRKAMGVNLSDIAAMAGVPVAAVVSVGMPKGFPQNSAEDLYRGVRELADPFQVAVVGGDTNRSNSGLVVCITLIGESTPRGVVRRSGARPGDWIMVTGCFGGRILDKHLLFMPRVREALTLHERYELHAMIDVSDGLAADLGHILAESGCGAVVRAAAIPIMLAARSAGGESSLITEALYDGEDFELLFTLAESEARRLVSDRPLDIPVTHIGEIVAGRQLLLEVEDGVRSPIEPRGYDHFRH